MRLWSVLIAKLSSMPSFASVINPGDEVIIQPLLGFLCEPGEEMVESTPVTFKQQKKNHFKATVRAIGGLARAD